MTTILTWILILIAAAVVIVIFLLFSKQRKPGKDLSALTDGKKEMEVDSAKPSESDDSELIAVLTAAISSFMGSNPNVKIHVKSFRRIGQETPVWNRMGRKEQIINNSLKIRRSMDK